jgi:hypothetical protein
VIVPILLVAAGLVAGCGGGSSSGVGQPTEFGGLGAYDAGTLATKVLAEKRGDPQSPLYRKLFLVKEISAGRAPSGRPAWSATLEDTDHAISRYCIWVWGVSYTPLRQVYDDAVGLCDQGTST